MKDATKKIGELATELSRTANPKNGGGYILLATDPVDLTDNNKDKHGYCCSINGQGIELVAMLAHTFRVNRVFKELVRHALLLDTLAPESDKAEQKKEEEQKEQKKEE